MRELTAKLRYGKQHLSLALPAGTAVLDPPKVTALPDPQAAIAAALARPIGAPPLAQIVAARRPRSVAITISDITRPVPNAPIVSALLDVLNRNGVGDDLVVIIVGTGMHRPSTAEEKVIMLGEQLVQRVKVIDHIAEDAGSLIKISDDPQVSINAAFMRSELKIVTGLIEPHFMAGYSGGRKGVCPALVDLQTVQRFHGYAVMADRGTVEGRLEGNPCHEIAAKVAAKAGVDFLVNVAITGQRQVAGVYAGDLVAAHAAGCRDVGKWTSATIDRTFDLVLTNAGGFPLDQNFYQSVKGMVAALPSLHEGSTLMIVSACHEIGSSHYTNLMSKYHSDWRRFLKDIAATERTGKDQWQYQMHARVLERIGVERLRFVGDGLSFEQQRGLAVNPVEGDAPAQARAQMFVQEYVAAHPGASIAVIPEGPYTMLRLSP